MTLNNKLMMKKWKVCSNLTKAIIYTYIHGRQNKDISQSNLY